MNVDVALVAVLVLVHPFVAMRADIAAAHVRENHRMYSSGADDTESAFLTTLLLRATDERKWT